MTTITAPLATITLQARVPDVVRSCIVQQPSPPPNPGETPPPPVTTEGIYTPVAPGVVYANLPTVSIVDTSPDQMIGCIIDTADNPQGRLNALFPAAIDGDGVIERSTNDIWVFDGTTWENVGPTPGPTIVTATIIPPWNEILKVDGTVRSKLAVESLPYALEQLTTVPAIGTLLGLAVQSSRALIRVPAAATTVGAEVPFVTSGAAVKVPAKATALSAPTPQVSGGASIAAPLTDLTFAASMVPYVGTQATVVQPGAPILNVSPLAPRIAGGASITAPAGDIATAALLPGINIVWGADIIATTGTFGIEEPSPLNNYFARRIFVATYTAAEMAVACNGAASATIYGLRFFVSDAPTYQPFPDYAIGAKNTTNLATSNNSGTNGGTFTAVRAAQSQSFTASQYVELLFDTPIAWTGNNFVFSWAWCATSDISATGQAPRGSGTSYYAQTNSAGCYTITSSVTNSITRRPVLQLLHKV